MVTVMCVDNGERMDGMLCKGHLINTLFGSRWVRLFMGVVCILSSAHRWSPKCVVHVVNMCRYVRTCFYNIN